MLYSGSHIIGDKFKVVTSSICSIHTVIEISTVQDYQHFSNPIQHHGLALGRVSTPPLHYSLLGSTQSLRLYEISKANNVYCR